MSDDGRAGSVAVDAGREAQLAGAQVRDVSAQTPANIRLAHGTPVASESLRERFEDLQANHRSGQLSATEARNTSRAAQVLFAATHPQLAESSGARTAAVSGRATIVEVYYYTDWYLTKDHNNWLGVEWWYDNEFGDCFGYTVTWDPENGRLYGNQFLYYGADGEYYGFFEWR